MKKYYIYSAFLAFLLSGNVTAQNLAETLGGMSVGQTSMAQKKVSEQSTRNLLRNLLPTYKVQPEVKKLYAPKAPQLTDKDKALFQDVDTMLCTNITGVINDESLLNIDYEFDQHGLRKVVDYSGSWFDTPFQLRYKYEFGPDNFWKSRLVEYGHDNDWRLNDLSTREINDKHQLVSQTAYDTNSEGDTIVISIRKYDYSHPYLFAEGCDNEHMAVGACVYESMHYGDGKKFRDIWYQWMESKQRYVVKQSISYDNEGKIESKSIGEVRGDELIMKNYAVDETGKEILKDKRHFFNDGGSYFEYFNDDGTLSSQHGKYTEVKRDGNSDGYTTFTHYKASYKGMVPVYRVKAKGLSDDRRVQPGKDFELLAQRYNVDAEKWSETDTIKGNSISGTLYRVTKKALLSSSNPEVDISVDGYISPKDNSWTPVNYLDNEKMTVVSEVKPDVKYHYRNTGVISYYNSNKEVVNRIKVNERVGGQYPVYSDIEPNSYFEWKDNSWKPLRSLVRFVENSHGVPQAIHYELDEQGCPVHSKTYLLYNGKEYLTSESKYENKEQGCKEIIYYYMDNKNRDGLMTVVTYEILPDKNLCITRKDCRIYNESEVLFSEKDIVDSQNMGTLYKYDSFNEKYEKKDIYCSDQYIYDEKTNLVTCYSPFHDYIGDTIVNSNKSVFYPEDNTGYVHTEEYDWDNKKEEWVGTRYEVEWPQNFDLEIIPFEDPDDYDDEGLGVIYAPHVYISSSPKINSCCYNWDAEKKDWVFDRQDSEELLSQDGNVYTIKSCSGINFEGQQVDTVTLTLDDDNRLLEKHTVGVMGNNRYDVLQKFTYDENKNLIVYDQDYKDLNDESENEHGVFYMTYKHFLLNPTAIEQMKVEQPLAVNGRKVTATGNALVEVFDLSGRKVMSGQGQLTLPSAGLYIVKSSGRSVKVQCR